MNNYVQISITGSIGGAKKYDFTKLFNPYVIPDIPQEWAATLNGTTTESSGVPKKSWKFESPIRYTDARSGYGSISDAVAIFNFRGTIKFIDWLTGTTYDVLLINKQSAKDSFNLRSATIDAANSLAIVTFEFREI